MTSTTPDIQISALQRACCLLSGMLTVKLTSALAIPLSLLI